MLVLATLVKFDYLGFFVLFFVFFRTTYSGSRLPDSPASPGASSTSSVSGSSQTLHETPRQQTASFGASYTVTSITPNGDRYQGPPNAHGAPKWSGLVAVDSEPRPAKSVGVTLKAHTASGTLYAIASGPSSPPTSPHTPETPIFGSTSQRHRRIVLSEVDGSLRLEGVTEDAKYQGEGNGAVLVNVEPIIATPNDSDKQEASQDASLVSVEEKQSVPFKETSLGAVITTVNTYKQRQSYEDITEASMSETVDQIEKAFGFRTPDMIANGTGSLERNGSIRKKPGDWSPSGSLQDVQLTPRRAQSGESLNRIRSSEDEDSPGNILKRLAKEGNREQDRALQRKSEGDLPQNLIKGRGTTTVVDASPNSVEVKTELRRKSEYEARVAARNILIERLGNKQALESENVEGIKIYHAKSRSTPVDVRNVNGEKLPRPRQTSQDDTAKVTVEQEEADGLKFAAQLARRKKSAELSSSKVRTPDNSRTSAKPVVRSERKIRLSSSASAALQGADRSQTVPRQRSSRRRHVVKQSLSVPSGAHSDSSDDELRVRSTDTMEASLMTAGKLHFTPEKNKKSSSLPREWDAGTSSYVTRDSRDTRESRSHRSHSHSKLRNARITKIKMSASEEPSDSIVDQTSRLLNAAKAVKYDKGSSLVVAEDVLHSLTRASDLLHNQSVVAREEKDKERKDKSLSRIKAPGE